MILYFREKNGDYMAVDAATNDYYCRLGWDQFEARSAAIEHDPYSICTVSVTREYLNRCVWVHQSKVPGEWWDAIGNDEEDSLPQDEPVAARYPAVPETPPVRRNIIRPLKGN